MDEQRALLAANHRSLSLLRLYWRIACTPLVAWLGSQDPGFLRSTEGALGRYLFERFTEFSQRRLLRDSFALHILYFGCYQPEGPLPIYLSRLGFDTIKKQIDRLELRCLRLEEAARTLELEGPSKWSLSDISCWMGEDGFRDLLGDLTSRLRPGDRFCYRNFGAIRSIPSRLLPWVERLSSLIEEVEEQDASVFFRLEIGEIRPRAASEPMANS
jgi:S-adenosylmethionine:diacylglycerol 3-amino-3-carboxypropyl transferase